MTTKFSLPKLDWWLLTPALLLVTVGLLTLSSLSMSYFVSQLVFTVGCLVIVLVLSRVDVPFLKDFGWIFYIGSLILLLVVFIVGIESHGATRWIDVFGVRLQFSELCKPPLALCLAGFLSNTDNRSLKSYFLVGILLFPVFFLIFFQPDLGNAMIYLLVTLITMLIFGYPLRWFLISAIPVVIASPFLWGHLHDYQRQRLLTFLDPASDPRGDSYNVMQAIIAVGSGGWMGKGFGAGTQSGLRFLPERHTDFIFATISEGLGFFGTVIVVLCFFFLCFRIYKIIQNSESTFEKLFAVCAFGFFLVHFFINAGMNAGIMPVVGVTLPFVSYGGSSLLSNFIFLGLLSNISVSQKRENVLEIR
jgi:rod shape determining protein RodA